MTAGDALGPAIVATTGNADPAAPLVVLLVFLGVYPKPVTDIVNPAVKQTLSDVQKKDPQPEVEAAK